MLDILAGLGLGGGLDSDENHPASRQRRFLWEFSEKYDDCTPSLGVRNNHSGDFEAQGDEKGTHSPEMYLN